MVRRVVRVVGPSPPPTLTTDVDGCVSRWWSPSPPPSHLLPQSWSPYVVFFVTMFACIFLSVPSSIVAWQRPTTSAVPVVGWQSRPLPRGMNWMHDDDDRGAFVIPRTTTTMVSNTRVRQRYMAAAREEETRRSDATRARALKDGEAAENQRALWVLATVPLAWGTFEPVVRFVYQSPVPIPGLLFGLAYYIVAVVTLRSLVAIGEQEWWPPWSSTVHLDTKTTITTTYGDADPVNLDPAATDAGSVTTANHQHHEEDSVVSWSAATRGGGELGTYLFLGNALQLVALETVPADRAAFLLQLTTLFVPLLQPVVTAVTTNAASTTTTSFSSSSSFISIRTWGACLIALVGVGVMSLDKSSTDDESTIPLVALDPPSVESLPSLLERVQPMFPSMPLSLGDALSSVSSGDALVMAAAILYTLHCLRLETWAQQTSALRLATAKAATETLWSFLIVVACLVYVSLSHADPTSFLDRTAGPIAEFVSTLPSTVASLPVTQWLPILGAIVWTGWVTVAYTIFAQSYGQRHVRPVTANLIYTAQPVWTALLAWTLLGERLGPAGYLGGSLICAAVVLVATEPSLDVADATSIVAQTMTETTQSR